MAKFLKGELFDNRYKLLKNLGGGQDAEVWTALDTLLDDEILVLKIFVRVGDGAIERFFEDFKLIRKLSHPHIIKPFDIGKWESQPYQKLDFIKKGSVFRRLEDDKTYTEGETALFLSQVASALDYLHANNVVHCDVKPENVLIKDNGDYILTDFGISQKMKDIFARVTMGKEANSALVGFSRAYAPPEISNKATVKPSRDIFSLGASLYELLTGELPFGADGGRALLMGAAHPNLPPIFSEQLNALIHKCLAKDPEQRPTARQLVLWANHYLENQAWDLTETREPAHISNSIFIPSRGTVVTHSNPKPSNHDAAKSIPTKPNYVLWGGIIAALMTGVLWLTWPQSPALPLPSKLSTDTAQVNRPLQKTQTAKTGTPITNRQAAGRPVKNTQNPLPAQSDVSLPKSPLEDVAVVANPNQTKIEELLLLGETAISRENNKDEAITYFTQARILNSKGTKTAIERFNRLYYIYEDKGDKIFEAEVYENAKKWYEVAQALNNTAEIRQKIESCDTKMKANN